MTRLDRLAYTLADRACIADIETECHVLQADGVPWWDTRPMTDPRELPDDLVEMNTQALAYAELRGLFTRHPLRPYLVRIQPQGTP